MADSMENLREAAIMTTLRRIHREDGKTAPLHALRRAYQEGYEAAMRTVNIETAKEFADDLRSGAAIDEALEQMK